MGVLAWCGMTQQVPPMQIDVWFYCIDVGNNGTLLSTNFKDPELGYHPCVNLHQEKLVQLRLNCEKLKCVYCTSNFLSRTCIFRTCIRFRLMLILNLRSLLQNQNLEIIPIYIVVLCFPHDNIVGIHLCEECKRSNVLNVCHAFVHFVTAPRDGTSKLVYGQ